MEKVSEVLINNTINRVVTVQQIEEIAKQLLKDIGMKLHCLGYKY